MAPNIPVKRHLRRLDKYVDVVFDVGVRKGTPALYRAFNQKPFYLIDPQIGDEEWLEFKPGNYKFFNIALGAKKGQMTFYEERAKSTFHKRTELTKSAGVTEHIVDVDTIDNFVKDNKIKGRIGLKLDTEGHELEIIKGMKNCLDQIAFIYCEASVRRRFEDSYNFSELVSAMYDKGFQFYNFTNNSGINPTFYDVIFLPKGHPLFD